MKGILNFVEEENNNSSETKYSLELFLNQVPIQFEPSEVFINNHTLKKAKFSQHEGYVVPWWTILGMLIEQIREQTLVSVVEVKFIELKTKM